MGESEEQVYDCLWLENLFQKHQKQTSEPAEKEVCKWEWLPSEAVTTEYGEKGDWDGERTDLMLLKDENGKKCIGRAYYGFIDGSEFIDWYDSNDYDFGDTRITHYCKIPFDVMV